MVSTIKMSELDIPKRLRELADMEEEYALKLLDIGGVGNKHVEMLIKSIGYDSQKHAGLYRSAARIIEGKSMSLMNSELDWLEEELRDHIRVEDEMVSQVKEIKEEIENERAKFLLDIIQMDEESHHPLMKKILNIVLEPETLEDQEVWDMMFGYLPRHGHALDPYAEKDTSTEKV